MATLTTNYQLLASSYDTFNGVRGTLKLYAKYTTQSIDNNTTNVSFYSILTVTNGGYIGDYGGVSWSLSDNQGHSTSRSGQSVQWYNGDHDLSSLSPTINHNSDGTKSMTMSASITFGNWGKTISVSSNVDLPTIPRKSTITSTSAYIGEVSQITISRKSTSFTHSIGYSFGNLSGYILADGSTTSTETKISETSIGFTVPSSFYNQIPNASQGNCTLTCKTYNGNTLIGTDTSTFVASVRESTNKPTVFADAVDVNQTTLSLTGNSGYFVKGYSNVSVSWTSSAHNGASITSNYINTTAVSVSPYVINNFVDDSIVFGAVDSRSFLNEYILEAGTDYNLIEYIPLTVSATFKRIAPTTGEVGLSFSGNYFNDTFGRENNTLSIRWDYKLSSDSSWTTGGTLVENTDYVISGNNFYSGDYAVESVISLGNGFDYTKAYDFRIVLDDELSNVTVNSSVTKGLPIVNWDDDHFNVNGIITVNELPFNTGVSGDTYPIGAIAPYAGDTAPTNWLICDGSAISRDDYAELFLVIGTTYGSGDGSTTFNLPNLKGRVAVGKDTSQTEFDVLGETGGEKTHTLTIQEIPSHNHAILNANNSGWDSGWNYCPNIGDTNKGYQNMGTESSGGGQSHNILQPYIVVNFIIKCSQSAGVVANVANVMTQSNIDVYSCNYINGIVESGSNADGNYVKYIDGTMICYGTHNLGNTTTGGNSDGALYYYDLTLIRNYAQEFVSKPHLKLNTYTNSGETLHYLWTAQKYNTAGNSSYSNYRIYSPTNTTLNISTEYIAIGRWK